MKEDLKEETDFEEEDIPTEIEPLILEPYTYENMMQNPIIKPIAEADRSLRAIEEIKWKKLIDANKDQDWVESKYDTIPRYSESPFIARLTKTNQELGDIIKLLNLQIKTLRECVTEVFDGIMDRYAVKIGNSTEHKEIETKIPFGGYTNYLTKLSEKEENTGLIAKRILEEYNKSKELNEDKKFQGACTDVYAKETDKPTKKIIGKIIRMEIV